MRKPVTSWQNPMTFSDVKNVPKMGWATRGGYDYGAFMGHTNWGSAAKGLRGLEQRRGAMGAARVLGDIGRASQPLSKTFNMMGRNVTYGRAALTGGLGMLALRNGANMMDRMRYGDYSGAMMSGALTAAAGYGAYASWMYKGALRSHFNNAASWILKRFR